MQVARGVSLGLPVTSLTLSLIITLRLTLILQPYANPNPPNPNRNPANLDHSGGQVAQNIV